MLSRVLTKLLALGLGMLLLGLAITAGGTVVLSTAALSTAAHPLLGPIASPLPSSAALAAIPPRYLLLYQRAATTCPGLPWTVLAGIGTVESSNGQSQSPGVRSGANSAGAEGPMQFEPATFALYDRPVPPGGARPPSPYDPTDAVYAAARDLCANEGGKAARLRQAVYAYNHANWYVAEVLAYASSYSTPMPVGLATRRGSPRSLAPSPAAAALRYALAQLGRPYRWGGEGHAGFDCSGLTQAAYRAAGVALPRTAQAQFDADPHLRPGTPLTPGDLVFFGSPTGAVQHVGLVVRPGIMVDAPHSGSVVRTEWFPRQPGLSWGDEVFLGATRPAPGLPGLVHLAAAQSR
jgi:hypothetical protein